MITTRQAILGCKEIPLVERYLISSVLDNSSAIFKNSYEVGCNTVQMTFTDGDEFVLEVEYNSETNKTKLIEVSSLDKILSGMDFNNLVSSYI